LYLIGSNLTSFVANIASCADLVYLLRPVDKCNPVHSLRLWGCILILHNLLILQIPDHHFNSLFKAAFRKTLNEVSALNIELSDDLLGMAIPAVNRNGKALVSPASAMLRSLSTLVCYSLGRSRAATFKLLVALHYATRPGENLINYNTSSLQVHKCDDRTGQPPGVKPTCWLDKLENPVLVLKTS
jgi:hypothetical protein